MQPPLKHSWIDLAELKNQLIKKIGPERSNQYFDYLRRFLSLKLSKLEFDKLCLKTISRDNISLHNQLIRSILTNACARKIPPPKHNDHSTSIGKNKRYDENVSIPVVHKDQQTEICAPLGISGAHKASTSGNNNKNKKNKRVGVFETGGLVDTIKLKEHMDMISATQGLQGVSMDCANVLNNGLDAYLKRVIRSFYELNAARSGREPIINNSIKNQANSRPLNGIRPGQHYQIQSQSHSRGQSQSSISLLDFKVAMELNPHQLGEDWPVLLEKICTSAFKE